MSEELLEVTEAEVLVDHVDVVVSLEREPDPNESRDSANDHIAEVIEVDFGRVRDVADHMAETAFDGIGEGNVVIYAPSQPVSAPAPHGPRRLHSDAGTANDTEVKFSTQSRAA